MSTICRDCEAIVVADDDVPADLVRIAMANHATDLPPMQITTNVLTPGVEMSVFIAMPDTTVWSGTIRRADAPRHGRIANLEGRVDD